MLAYACFYNFTLYQMEVEMEVESAFLNAYIKEKVFIKQPPGFDDPSRANNIYQL